MGQKLDNATKLYLEGIRDGRVREAVTRYTGARYTQHSTGVADGIEGFVAFFEPFIARNPQRDIRIIRGFEDGRYVFVQAYQCLNHGEAEWVTTDFFDTDENDKIIEHWDVIAPYLASNPAGHSSIDGTTELSDLDKTEDNKALVQRFIDEVLLTTPTHSQTRATMAKYVSSQLIQHGAETEDGLEAFAAKLESGSLSYQACVLLVGKGNMVATLCKVHWQDQPCARVDIFRLAQGRIVEMWENTERIDAPETWVNSGKF